MIVLHHQYERVQIGIAQQDRPQRLHQPPTASNGVDRVEAHPVHFAVQMGEKRRRIEVEVEAQRGNDRWQAGGNFGGAVFLRAADEFAQQRGNQKVGNGRRLSGGFHAHDMPCALRQTSEEFVQ